MEPVIGKNIKSLRLILGRTLDEFAGALGVDSSLISRIENGSRSATAELVQKICDTYGVSINRIYATDFLAVLPTNQGDSDGKTA